jgi:hypothetical protein
MEKILGAFWYLKDRLKEPSTLVALAVITDKAGVHIDQTMIDSALNLVSIAAGMAGFFMSEGKALGRVS